MINAQVVDVLVYVESLKIQESIRGLLEPESSFFGSALSLSHNANVR